MNRIKKGKNYTLDKLELKEYDCSPTDYIAYHAVMSYKKGAQPASLRQNDTPTNVAELSAYAENSSLFSAMTVQCECAKEGNKELFSNEKIPAFADFYTPDSKEFVPLNEAMSTLHSFEKNEDYKLHSVTRNGREMTDGSSRPTATAYIIYMQPNKK